MAPQTWLCLDTTLREDLGGNHLERWAVVPPRSSPSPGAGSMYRDRVPALQGRRGLTEAAGAASAVLLGLRD